MRFDPSIPFNVLPGLPPAHDIETKPILRACIQARAAVAELKQAGRLIPNQAVLINSIPLLEAQASSEIENIVTTSDALFRYAQAENKNSDPATKEVLRYRHALYQGYLALKQRPLNTNTAVDICSQIKNVHMEIRRIPGTALANAANGEIIYTPPLGEPLLREKLADWEHFVHDQTDIDPLIRMAVAHYQFEAIHPFTDGNGRTGRIINLLMMIQHDLLELPVLYLSRYILQNKSDYYRLLLAVTKDEAWEEWILFMLTAVTETAHWTTEKIRAIHALQTTAIEHIKMNAPNIYSRELVEVLFEQPYCRISNLMEKNIAKRQTASIYLNQLTQIGVLIKHKAGREVLFVHPSFIRLLTSEEHKIKPYAVVKS